jgi:tetratricopeptide (TPR) repeat protein
MTKVLVTALLLVFMLGFGREPARAAAADPAPAAGVDATSLSGARLVLRRGQPEKALSLLTPLLGQADVGDEAGRLALWALRLDGQWEKLRELAATVPPAADPRLVGPAAETLAELGDDHAAFSLLDQAMALYEDGDAAATAALHVARGAVHAGCGERAAARAEYERVPAPGPDATPPPAAALGALAGAVIDSLGRAPGLDWAAAAAADELVIAGRAAWGRGEFQAAKNIFERAVAADPGHEEAPLRLAALLLEKHETQLARSILGPVFHSNPQHTEAGLLLARTHFADGRYREVEDICQRALQVDPRHPAVLELLAMLDLADEDADAAAAKIDAALAVAPGRRSLLALRAGLLLENGDRVGAERDLAAILAGAPHYADAYFIAGGTSDRLRRYPEAAEFYARALGLDPEHAPAANALGLSAMRDGREEEAGKWLDRGFALDPYDIRTYNMRLLLAKLAGYRRFETAHFILKVDERDVALVPLLGPYLEAVYAELCPRFGFTPERKTTVEVFAERDLLSARLIGLPGIEGIPGACFGPVIAMDSPRLWEGKINWQTVLRHEFGHVLALTRTEKQVPFWFTEGLSVVLEEYPPAIASDRIARWALFENEIIPFTELNHGFTRPKTPLHRSLAYYESAFAVRRLIDQHGFDAVLGMLDDYAAGLSNAAAIEKELQVAESAWAADVDRAMRAHVESLPVWALGSGERLAASVKQAEANRADLDARTRMAEEWFQSGEIETAVSEALAVLEADSSHSEARLLLGHALLIEGDLAGAVAHLAPLLDENPVSYLVVRDLGLAYADLGENAAAAAYLAAAIEAYPADPEPYRKLAEIREREGNFEEAADVLARLATVEEAPFDDLVALADLCREHGLAAGEAAALEQSLAVRPFERDPVARLARLYRQAGAAPLAVRTYEVLCLLDPASIEAHAALVELALDHGPPETARRYAEQLLELDPASALARRALAPR